MWPLSISERIDVRRPGIRDDSCRTQLVSRACSNRKNVVGAQPPAFDIQLFLSFHKTDHGRTHQSRGFDRILHSSTAQYTHGTMNSVTS